MLPGHSQAQHEMDYDKTPHPCQRMEPSHSLHHAHRQSRKRLSAAADTIVGNLGDGTTEEKEKLIPVKVMENVKRI